MNKKGFANIILVIVIFMLVGMIGYFTLYTPTTAPAPSPSASLTGWQLIDANSFTLYLPPNWKFNKLQGIDSQVGEFVGDGAKLGFDYGWYSGSLAKDDDLDHIISYEIIAGYRAKVVVPKVTGNGMTGVYFNDLGNANRLSLVGNNLTASQQEIALGIFRTLKFKK